MNAIFQMLNPSNTLTVNRLLAHAIGLSEAVVYAALISKCSYYERNGMLDDSGWFYSTVPDLEASTALSEYQQKRCIKNLVDAGLIESKNRGLPAKRCFRIIEDIELISNLISQGEKKQLSIKPAAVQSYEKKRKNRIAERGKVLVIDFDGQANSSRFFAEPKAGLETALIKRNCLPTMAKSSTRYHNIDILTATPALNLVAAQFEQLPEDVQTANVRKVLTFDRSYEYAVLDLPPALTKLTEKVIMLSDSLFVPIELGTFLYDGDLQWL